jgi:streptomycin 6-kinase
VLKLGFPHWEGRDEIAGLRAWAGDPTVTLLEADEAANAMLLERCEPGTPLRSRPHEEQDRVVAALLRRAWHVPARAAERFRHLSEHARFVRAELERARSRWPDAAQVAAALDDMERLSQPREGDRLLMTDLHAGNVLAAAREPWLAIDPKPFVGDPAFDGTQHLLNALPRLRRDGLGVVTRFADLLEVDEERLLRWVKVRLVVSDWGPRWPLAVGLARRLAG